MVLPAVCCALTAARARRRLYVPWDCQCGFDIFWLCFFANKLGQSLSIGSAPLEAVREGTIEAVTFLMHSLIPHAQSVEQVVYPTIGRLLRTLEATATMSRDHLEVIRLTEELEEAR